MSWSGIFSEKQSGSVYDRIRQLASSTVIFIAVIALFSVFFITFSDRSYQRNMTSLSCVIEFYDALSGLDKDVFSYAGTGDEMVYGKIWDEIITERGMLADLAQQYEGSSLYRRVRDLQEMFFTYTECVGNIKEHVYLCDVMTTSGNRLLSSYYQKSIDILDAMRAEYPLLYEGVLDSVKASERTKRAESLMILADIAVVMVILLLGLAGQGKKLFRNIVRPLRQLTDRAQKVSISGGGELGAEPVITSSNMNEEIRNLIDVYNQMTDRIRSQVEENQKNADAREKLKDQELENLKMANLLKSSELKALQMQINPHYLFNTLNMIAQTAYLEEADQTRQLLSQAAALFRYTLDFSGKTVTLQREMEILGAYVELQEKRFGDRIFFEFHLDEQFSSMPMPAMTLQPIVENAIEHGVGMKVSDAVICIRTYVQGETDRKEGVIEIADNGTGMTKEELSTLLGDMRGGVASSRRIGLSNVYQRLKLYYGERADMDVESTPDEGTCVRIRILLESGSRGKGI